MSDQSKVIIAAAIQQGRTVEPPSSGVGRILSDWTSREGPGGALLWYKLNHEKGKTFYTFDHVQYEGNNIDQASYVLKDKAASNGVNQVISDALAQAKTDTPPSDRKQGWIDGGEWASKSGPAGSKIWYRAPKQNSSFVFDHVEYNGQNYTSVPSSESKPKKASANGDYQDSNSSNAQYYTNKSDKQGIKAEKAKSGNLQTIKDARKLQAQAGGDVVWDDTPLGQINAKQAAAWAPKAKAYVDDYNSDISAIKQARALQTKKGDDLIGGKNLGQLSGAQADKLGDQARKYIAVNRIHSSADGSSNTGGNSDGGVSQGDGASDGVSSSTGSSDGSGGNGGGASDHAKDLKRGGGKDAKGHKRQDGDDRSSRGDSGGGSNSSFAPDPNGNNLTARFAKVFGPDAQAKLDEAIAAYNASGAGTITTTGTVGKYGYSYTLTDKTGKVVTETDEIKKQLLAHVTASASISKSVADPHLARTLTAYNLQTTTGGGNMTGISRRIATAYTSGDQAKATELITQAASKHPDKIQIVNPGQPGSYIKVQLPSGEWTTKADDVAKVLASNVRVDGAKPVAYNQQSRQQQAVLSGANGMAVMNRLNYAMNTTGTERLQHAIDEYNKKNGADIKIHGTLGQPGFYLSLNTPNGQISGTNAILKKLQPHSGTRVPGEQVAPPPADPAAPPPTPPAGDPGTTPPPTSDDGDGTGGSDSGDGGNSGSSGSDGAQGTDGTNGQNQGQKPDNKPKGSVDNGSKEKEKATADILSISAAAQKSQALIGVELKQPSGQVAKPIDQKLYAAADHSQNNIINKNESARYVKVANTDGNAGVSRQEAKSYNKALNIVDKNDDGKVGKKEAKAFVKAFDASGNNNVSNKEIKAALKASIDSKPKKDPDLRQQYLPKGNNKSAGGTEIQELSQAAMISSQLNKPKNKDNDGPGGKGKKGKGKG